MVESRRFVGNPHSCFSWAVYLLRAHDGRNYDICNVLGGRLGGWHARPNSALRGCVPSSRCSRRRRPHARRSIAARHAVPCTPHTPKPNHTNHND